MSEKLKPCPFCGGTKICTEKGINLNYCDNCSAESNVERWNTRPIEDDLRNRIAELEAENIRLGIEYQRMRLALGDIAINSKRALNESPTDQLTVHSDIERQDDKSPNDTQTQTIVYGKEREE